MPGGLAAGGRGALPADGHIRRPEPPRPPPTLPACTGAASKHPACLPEPRTALRPPPLQGGARLCLEVPRPAGSVSGPPRGPLLFASVLAPAWLCRPQHWPVTGQWKTDTQHGDAARCVHQRVPRLAPRKDPGPGVWFPVPLHSVTVGPAQSTSEAGFAVDGMEGGPAALDSHLGLHHLQTQVLPPCQTLTGSKTLQAMVSSGTVPWTPSPSHLTPLASAALPQPAHLGAMAPGQPLPCLFPAAPQSRCLLAGPPVPPVPQLVPFRQRRGGAVSTGPAPALPLCGPRSWRPGLCLPGLGPSALRVARASPPAE